MQNPLKFWLLMTVLLTNLASNANANTPKSAIENDTLIEMINNTAIADIEQLINYGLDINATIVGDGTPLIIAVRANNQAVVESLIQWGADVNKFAHNDANPLTTAAINNHLPLAELLLLQGAKVNNVVDNDETALINASREGHYQMIKLLVNNGADVNLAVTTKTQHGSEIRSPLNSAKTTEIRDYLIHMGAKV